MLVFSPNTKMTEARLLAFTHVTVTAADVVETGLRAIEAAVVSLVSDPLDDPMLVSATWTGGTLTIRSWRLVAGVPAPAETFGTAVAVLVMGR